MKELIMCYRVHTGTQKDESKVSSRKVESVSTPREDIDARETAPLTSESGAAAMVKKLFTPFRKDEGGMKTTDDFEMKPAKTEVEKVD
jgi:hypothetical protein